MQKIDLKARKNVGYQLKLQEICKIVLENALRWKVSFHNLGKYQNFFLLP
jgi:hypothetical protein